jgi:hypothetical protein
MDGTWSRGQFGEVVAVGREKGKRKKHHPQVSPAMSVLLILIVDIL